MGLKILFITHLYHPAVGGAERVFQRMAEGLAARGHDVTVLTSDALSTEQYALRVDTGLPTREALNGVSIVRDSIRGPWYRFMRPFDRAATRLGRFGAVVRPLIFGPHFGAASRPVLRRRYDAVIAGPTPTTALFHGLACKWRSPGTKLVLFPHMHVKDGLHTSYVNRWALRRADAVLALTEVERRHLRRQRIRGDRIVRVVNAVDDHVFEARESSVREEGAYILYLGQEGEHKRIPLLVQAMEGLWDRERTEKLVIAGARTGFSATIDKILSRLPETRRRMVLRLNDIPEESKAGLLDRCRVLVNPSSFEAFGIVFLEAWARGKPVIGADIPAVREIIGSGDKGLLFRDRDAKDLEAKIEFILGNVAAAERMGRAGRAEVAAKYRWDDVVRALESLLLRRP